jgi:hypothetical protein
MQSPNQSRCHSQSLGLAAEVCSYWAGGKDTPDGEQLSSRKCDTRGTEGVKIYLAKLTAQLCLEEIADSFGQNPTTYD